MLQTTNSYERAADALGVTVHDLKIAYIHALEIAQGLGGNILAISNTHIFIGYVDEYGEDHILKVAII